MNAHEKFAAYFGIGVDDLTVLAFFACIGLLFGGLIVGSIVSARRRQIRRRLASTLDEEDYESLVNSRCRS